MAHRLCVLSLLIDGFIYLGCAGKHSGDNHLWYIYRLVSRSLLSNFIKDRVALTGKEAKLIRTRDADPAAYLAIRFWTSKAVKMQLSDSRDSTPYWLITSNNPQALAAALKS
jgi:hypothetical protein